MTSDGVPSEKKEGFFCSSKRSFCSAVSPLRRSLEAINYLKHWSEAAAYVRFKCSGKMTEVEHFTWASVGSPFFFG